MNACPEVAAKPPVAVQDTCVVAPDVSVVAATPQVPTALMPPYVSENPPAPATVAVLAVPVFDSETLHTGGDTFVHVTTLADTCAVLVNDPKRPKTNPAMATAAMSVMAMRMTVASTGEMAFLFFLRTFSKFIVRLNASCSVYKSRMEYLSSFR